MYSARGEERDHAGASVTAQRRGGKKKITICFQGQTRTVKKSRLGNFPGATRGACPVGGNTGGTGGGQQPVACTRWIISGGPNPTDMIHVDDDLNFWRASNGAGILTIMDRKADPITPVPFEAQVGEVLTVRAFDWGGCRSMSELWLHCIETGQKRRLLASYSGNGSCSNGYGIFVDARVTVEL